MKTILKGGLIVTAEQTFQGDVVIDGELIESVGGDHVPSPSDRVIDVERAYVMAGVIDTHVHFREPGMTHKATIYTESRAALAGGVTSVLEMPNCKPATTSAEALAEKQRIAQRDAAVNMAFFAGATRDNVEWLRSIDYTQVPGIKVFMGSSTGGMLLDDDSALRRVFAIATDVPVVTHCEDTAIIDRNAAIYGDSGDFRNHALIRSKEACIASSQLAISLAKECGARLHIAHISTAEEVAMIADAPGVTGEACLPHIVFSDDDYETLGARIKCNPAVKTKADREAVRQGLLSGTLTTVATDHAPHLLSEKMAGGCLTAPSGMPMVQFSLPLMLDLFKPEDVTRWMSLNPARLFGIVGRGELRPGYYADITVVRKRSWTVTDNDVVSLCHWSPLAGRQLGHQVVTTLVGGGQNPAPLRFNHTH